MCNVLCAALQCVIFFFVKSRTLCYESTFVWVLCSPNCVTKVCVASSVLPWFPWITQNGVKHLTQVFRLSMGSLNDWPFTMECFRPSEQNRHEEDHEKSKHLSWLHNKFKLTFQSLTPCLLVGGPDLEIDIYYYLFVLVQWIPSLTLKLGEEWSSQRNQPWSQDNKFICYIWLYDISFHHKF